MIFQIIPKTDRAIRFFIETSPPEFLWDDHSVSIMPIGILGTVSALTDCGFAEGSDFIVEQRSDPF